MKLIEYTILGKSLLIFWIISWGSYFFILLTNKEWILNNIELSIFWFYGTFLLIGILAIIYVIFEGSKKL